MANFIYCGIDKACDESGTQCLLFWPGINAIWYPYPPLKSPQHQPPKNNDRVWLIWRDATRQEVLGGGRIYVGSQGRVGWTETKTTLRGARAAAIAVGYKHGPTNMTFLRLIDVVGPQMGRPSLSGVQIQSGLNDATPRQVQELQSLLNIP